MNPRQNQIYNLKLKAEDLNAELAFTRGEISYADRCFDQKETLKASCDVHGEFTQHRIWMNSFGGRIAEKRSRCPACIVASLEETRGSRKALQVALLTDNANIAERFDGCTLENYVAVNDRARRNLGMLKTYAKRWPDMYKAGTSLILSGKPGTGKNHLAVGLAKAVIAEHQASVLLTSVLKIIRAVRRSWGKNSEYSEEEVIAMYTDKDLLIIDEIGVQYSSDSEKITLFEILNTRYERMLPTVMISNLTPEQISMAIGDRLTDRMVEGQGTTLIFDWESYRSQKGAQSA
ncbi:ATP-binding protein [Pantoea ananatis]|uniref:ATP-binding protein n=1 Tax=Pantoea ananas TaxID=553 RepID=UPI001FF67821|nr:ATP-binding protein [Pantoea ananatis]MCK0552555.1 ATP-binding protein [Pantoea ananatis]